MLFGDLHETQELIGTAEDAATDETMFGKLDEISEYSKSGKDSAGAALSVVTDIQA